MKKQLTSMRRVLSIFLLFCTITLAENTWAETGLPPETGQNGRYVSIDFNDVEIGVFIKFISELTGKNFVVDQRVNGKVTIISPSKISIDEAFKVFESVLEVNGFAAVKAGEVTKIVPAPDARTKNIKTLLQAESNDPDDRIITQLIPMKYASPDEIKKLFTPLISKNSVLLDYAPTNMLILTDTQSNVQRLLNILKVIDVADIGQQLTVIPVRYADSTKLVSLLESVFDVQQQRARGAAVQGIKIVADERTNTLVVLASEGETERVKDLIRLLDKETPMGNEKIRVYYLEHAKAEDLATALQSLKKEKTTSTPGKKEPLVSGNVNITADKATNSLIIMAEKEEYMILEDIIKKLDIRRSMVYIECLIMEVNVNKDFNLGVEWRGGDDFNNGKGVYFGGFSGGDTGYSTTNSMALGTFPPGYSMGVFNNSIKVGNVTFPAIGAVITAYKKDKDVHILSTPQILTTDNEEASITVGKNIPFQTKTSVDSTIPSEAYNSYEYKDVGITLKITPQISKDRLVRLLINQEVSRLESTVDFKPTTLKRTINTTVIVNDNSTVVIGGLIDNSFSDIEYKTPCLGEIPGFGKLFSSTGNTDEKTNLFVFLTPHVIQNQTEAKTVYEEKKEKIESVTEGKIKLYDERTK
jgi:general secretion pathway protein D